MADLKPCPFCGENLVLKKQDVGDESIVNYYAHEYSGDFSQSRYRCFIGTIALYHEGVASEWAVDGGKRVEQWNSRPIEDAKDATIERMRGLLREAKSILVVMNHFAPAKGTAEIIARIDAELKEGDMSDGYSDLALASFREFAESCPHRVVPGVERRPGNALNVEIGSPCARCSLKVPDDWKKRGMSYARWWASGGSPLVLGPCSRNCALGHTWCDECGHRGESHDRVSGICRVDDGGWPCGCEHEMEATT